MTTTTTAPAETTDEAITRLESEIAALYERLYPYRKLHLPLASVGPTVDLTHFLTKQEIATEIDGKQIALAQLKLARDHDRLADLTATRAEERDRDQAAVADAKAQRIEAERALMDAQRREREAKERLRDGDEAITHLHKAIRQHEFDIGRWHEQRNKDQHRMEAALSYPAR